MHSTAASKQASTRFLDLQNSHQSMLLEVSLHKCSGQSMLQGQHYAACAGRPLFCLHDSAYKVHGYLLLRRGASLAQTALYVDKQQLSTDSGCCREGIVGCSTSTAAEYFQRPTSAAATAAAAAAGSSGRHPPPEVNASSPAGSKAAGAQHQSSHRQAECGLAPTCSHGG